MCSASRTVALAVAFTVAALFVGMAKTVVAQPAVCWGVEVVDGGGRPVPGAEVTQWYGDPDSERGIGGQAWDTDQRGWACSEAFVEGALIDVNAPAEPGGECAGTVRVTFQPPFTRVVMTLRPRRQGVLRGRVVSPDHRPIVGAFVSIDEISWMRQECVVTPQGRVVSEADGSFSFPQLPRGSAVVRIEHDRFARREITVRVPGTTPYVVMTAGAREFPASRSGGCGPTSAARPPKVGRRTPGNASQELR